MLAEQHDEWAEQRRYLGLEVLAKARAVLAEREASPETTDTTEPLPANDLIAGALSA